MRELDTPRGEFGDEVSAAHRTLQQVIRISEAPPKEGKRVVLGRAWLGYRAG